jgi:tetrahydromethanopterin S-methyltransferase subunit G
MKKNLKETKKEIGLDDIARIVQDGFLKIDEKFNIVDKRFDDVDKRFDDVDKRFNSVEKRLISVEKKIDHIEGEIIKKVDKNDHSILKYRVEKLEKKFA